MNTARTEKSSASHTVLMDKVYRRQRHFYDLTRKYYLLGRDRLVRELGARPGERIAELGCGTARNMILIAERYPGVALYGLDASVEMLQTASQSVSRAKLESRVALKHGLAEEMTPAFFAQSAPFDRAIFSYSLSMIPDWRAALTAAADAVSPGGHIHIVDFGDLKGLPPFAERMLRAWLRLFHVAPRDALLAAVETARLNAEECSLSVLPGRYAFVLRASPVAIRQIAKSGNRP